MPPKAAGRGATRRPAERETAPAGFTESASSSTTPSTRPPVQRLQSLNRRTPGGSIGPRGGPLSRDELGGPTKPALKYAPRSANRRTKEERDAILELEAERNRQRLSEAEAIQRARLGNAPRVRGRGGRGGMMFGGPGGSKRGRGGRFENDSRSSPALRHTLSRSHTPAHWRSNNNAGYSSDEDEQASALRISIDEINLDEESDEEAEVEKDPKGKKAVRKLALPLRGPRPIRVERHEHEERVVSVDVEASTTASAEPSSQAAEEEESDNELFISEEPTTPRVKREPADGDVAMADVPHAEDRDETPLPAQRRKARKSVLIKDPRSLLRTKEEIDEFDRHNEDLEALKDILTPDEPVTVEKTTTTTEAAGEGEEGAEPKEGVKEEEEPADKNAGRLYLIQFPPLTPNLTVPGAAEPMEVQDDIATQDVTELQDHSIGEPAIKREEGEGEEDIKPAKRPPGKLVTATQRQLPAGRVGRLHLHKSGRVTLDWGGISFELDKGANVNFVQEAVIASGSTIADGEEDAGERAVWSMGQLSEKFIASPEWNKLL